MSETFWTVTSCILTSMLYGLLAGFFAGELLRKQRSEELASVVSIADKVVVAKFAWADNKRLQVTVALLGAMLFYLGWNTNSSAQFQLTGGVGSFVMTFVCLFYWRRYHGRAYFRGGF